MKRIHYVQCLLELLILGLFSSDLFADGGVIRLREVQGPFVVTIFTPPELVQNDVADVSLMVQRQDSGEVILDATVDLTFKAPTAASTARLADPLCGTSTPSDKSQVTATASRQEASNKLLYAAPVKLFAAGNWQLEAFIKSGSDQAKLACNLPVGPHPPQLASLVPYLALPPLVVVLFLLHQSLLNGRLSPKREN